MAATAAPTERLPAIPPPGPPAPAAGAPARRAGLSPDVPATVLLAALICSVTFYAKGGLTLAPTTWAEIGLTLLSGVVLAAVVLLWPQGARPYGASAVALLAALAALTAVSIAWSVQPDASWQDASRMFAYTAVFAAAAGVARIAPSRWTAVIASVALASVVICGWALLTKVFPASLAAAERYARLEAPFGYWNAVGLTAATGAIACLWLGARRSGHALLTALAYPAMGVLLLTLALAYSRGALAALAVGVVLWLAIVPLRLRGATLLIVAGAGAAVVAAWDFSRHALSTDAVEIAERTRYGHELGALIAVMVIALAAAGVAIGFQTARAPVREGLRRRAGAALLVALALLVLAFCAALAHSHRGFTGTISHAVSALTDPNAKTPPNTPDRLTAVASVRARYWKEALEVFSARPVLGAGAASYQTARQRYRAETLEVRHAHGFIVQTLSDLGVVGLAVVLALLAAWLAAAGRSSRPFDGRLGEPVRRLLRRPAGPGRTAYTAERVGLLSMLCVAVVFGAHSLIDWAWYVPGNSVVALLCAGWLAGRGPLAGVRAQAARPDGAAPLTQPEQQRAAPRITDPVRAVAAAVVIVGALLVAWSQWQPQRAEVSREQALELVGSDKPGALQSAERAVEENPLSAEALITLADIQQVAGRPAAARATLVRAVREQPSNPVTWLAIARYDLAAHSSRAAVREFQAAIYLNPESIAAESIAKGEREAVAIHNEYIEALRAEEALRASQAAALTSARARHSRAAAGGPSGGARQSGR